MSKVDCGERSLYLHDIANIVEQLFLFDSVDELYLLRWQRVHNVHAAMISFSFRILNGSLEDFIELFDFKGWIAKIQEVLLEIDNSL